METKLPYSSCPPDEQLIEDAGAVVSRLKTVVKYILVSHDHEDHFDPDILKRLKDRSGVRHAVWIKPKTNYVGLTRLDLGGELS